MIRWFLVFAVSVAFLTANGRTSAASPATKKQEVTVNGVAVPRATSSIENSIDAIEFRSGSGQTIQLIPGDKRYAVCVSSRGPIGLLDAQFPTSASTSRFTVGVEDGRTFTSCLLVSLSTERSGAKRRYIYCLRCEDVTAP